MEFSQIVAIMGYWIGGAAFLFIVGIGGYMWFLRSHQMQGG